MPDEYYQDRYGRRRGRTRKNIDSRSAAARQAGVRNAEFDFWGNLVRGKYVASGMADGEWVDEGDEFRGSGPTNLDRYKAGMMTPRLDAYRRQFGVARTDASGSTSSVREDNPQMTSWGKSWADAARAARNVDSAESRAARMPEWSRQRRNFMQFKAAQKRLRR